MRIEQEKQEVEQETQKKEQDRIKHKKIKRDLTIISIILVFFFGLSIFSYYPIDSPTGFVIGTKQVTQTIHYNTLFEHYTETQLELSEITSLRVSGTLEGTRATIKLRLQDGTELVVADITNQEESTSTQGGNLITGLVLGEATEPEPTVEQEPVPTEPEYVLNTEKNEYALGETVFLGIEPEPEDYSLYIAFAQETHKLEEGIYVTENVGEHKALALIVLPDDILHLETSFTVTNTTINETEPINKTETNETEPINESTNENNNEANAVDETANAFDSICVETCILADISNPVLIIELEGESKLTITEIIITQTKENLAPEQSKVISDLALGKGETIILNMNEYFSDPDEDEIVYDIVKIPEIEVQIDQASMSISSENPGIYTAFIYATDGDKLITSNVFEISIASDNEIINQTTNETSETTPTTETTTALPADDPCNNPNPNMRPPECIQGNEEQYFKDQSIYLKNLDRALSARITAFGNLVITGNLIENSQASPGPRDFKISYETEEGEIITAWISTDTGDLHLRGNLYEEQFSLVPTGKVFLIQNRKGTNLGYFDRYTGNLYLRGNLIQNKESVE